MKVESICNNCNHKQQVIVDVSQQLINEANQKAEEGYAEKLQSLIEAQAAIDESNEKIEQDKLEIESKIKAGIEESQVLIREAVRKEVTKEVNEKAKIETGKAMEASKEAIEKEAEAKWQKILDDTNKKNDAETERLKTQYSKAQKGLNDANRKINQTSMQIQGATAEKSAFEWLRDQFTFDHIEATKNGADITHTILSNGKAIGKILYEIKDTQNFSSTWPAKLKKDVQDANATLGVIISKALPEEHMKYGISNGVIICSPDEAKTLSYLLRMQVVQRYKDLNIVKNHKQLRDLLWEVVTGVPFQQKFIAIHDAFQAIVDLTIADKKYHSKKWIKEEKQQGIVIENLLGMHGLLQEQTGNALQEIPGLEYVEEDHH